jgi:hypothetical protein
VSIVERLNRLDARFGLGAGQALPRKWRIAVLLAFVTLFTIGSIVDPIPFVPMLAAWVIMSPIYRLATGRWPFSPPRSN